ncbi:Ger(x)C family spore germination protein [Thalassobacillus sp. B23F22_16]|uniref:Ger(x)C family spore germination protein n=1 Tax=Thalassobacillus sp. B23F22_16 TaxID=3459513 RepID=UPI00373E7D53
MFRKALFLLFSLLLLSGCWDSKAVDQIVFVSGLGIDYQDGEFLVYARILPFQNVGKQEGSGAQGAQDFPLWGAVGTGSSFDSATDDLYYTTQEPISWAHIGEVVFTTRALEKKAIIDEVVDVLNRYSETRSAPWLYVTDEELPTLAQARPILGTSPWYSRVNDPFPVFGQFSTVKPKAIRDYLINRYEPGKVFIIPMIQLNTSKWTKDNQPHPIHEFGGAAFIDHGEYRGSMNAEEAKGLRWMEPESERIPLYLYKDEKDYASIVFTDPKVEVKPRVERGEVKASITVEVAGEIIENPFDEKDDTLKEMAEKKIEEQIRSTYQKGVEFQVDVYQIGYHLYQEEPQAFKKLIGMEESAWLKENTLSDVQVKVDIVSSGRIRTKK